MSEPSPEELVLVCVPCPLCGSERFAPHVRLADYFCGVAGEFAFVRCERCRHVYLNPQPTPETIHLAYPADYGPHRGSGLPPAEDLPSHDMRSPPPDRPWYARQPFRSIPGLRTAYRLLMNDNAEYVPEVAHARPSAAELGFGSGRFLRRLLDADWTVRGYDASGPAVERALAQGLPVEQGTVEQIELPEGAYDAVFAWMTLEHLHDPRRAALKVRRSLKPGGAFCFSVPNFGCWEPGFFGKYWLGYDAPRHLHQFTPASLRRILRDAGFESVRVIHQRNMRYVYGSWGARLLDRNPRSLRGARLMQAFRSEPRLFWQLAMAPIAILFALLRQSGRITVVARVGAASSEERHA